MKKKGSILILVMSIMLVLMLSDTSMALDSATGMQCGEEIVSVGASQYDVKQKCGEPTSIEPGSDIGTEQWIYNFGSTEFVYYLTFVNGFLVQIETGGYGH